MDSDNKEEKKKIDPNEFGKVIDALHNKQKLSSLRTYQGDMADFIKEKNESVVSIAVKEKERKEEKMEEEGKLEPVSKPHKERFQVNLTILALSILLIGGGLVASLYVFNFIKKEPVNLTVIENNIIPYNNLITLANVTDKSLGPELGKLSFGSGVSVIKISDASGLPVSKVKDFFSFMKISPPGALLRTLKNEYAIGAVSQDKKLSFFLVLGVDNFGNAFSAMLDWEENMEKDLSFLNTEDSSAPANLTASTTLSVRIPMKPEVWSWKDIIIKNKDVRGLVNTNGQAKIAYTFLDKNTILIINNLSAIGEISSVYSSRGVAR